ncbi:MAG: ATP-binding protein, partial [Oscillospiraceae bacterium]
MEKLMAKVRAAVDHYGMIAEGDRIAVGVSGGKDSLFLLTALHSLSRYYPQKFELTAITADPCFQNTDTDFSQVQELCRRISVPYIIRRTDLSKIVFADRQESNPCSLCARMRRGILHNMARELSCNKIALGHHGDDAVETFLMN